MLFFISENSTNIYYKEFTRNEESHNGADWEWWILTSGYYDSLKAYRFLVQAKKLIAHNGDNYPLLSYGNRNGYQIDMLMYSAKYKHAFPLYMFYSISNVDIDKQIDEYSFIDKSIIEWCECCVNGCYLSPASKVYSELYNKPRHKLKDIDLLNKSLKLSLLDKLFESDVERILSRFNREYAMSDSINMERMTYNSVFGIQYTEKSIPDYLKTFIKRRGEDLDWLQREMQINDIEGIGVIDCRKGSINGLA